MLGISNWSIYLFTSHFYSPQTLTWLFWIRRPHLSHIRRVTDSHISRVTDSHISRATDMWVTSEGLQTVTSVGLQTVAKNIKPKQHSSKLPAVFISYLLSWTFWIKFMGECQTVLKWLLCTYLLHSVLLYIKAIWLRRSIWNASTLSFILTVCSLACCSSHFKWLMVFLTYCTH